MTATLSREEALSGCNAVLSSYRPGGFEARALDERIPLTHGVIGQETQGPGGFFMALRAVHVAKGLVADMQRLCPGATLFNYTNPVNIVAQAVADHSPVKVVSLCEGPIVFPRELAEFAGLDPGKVRAPMVGLNHACWSTEAEYDGRPMIPLLAQALENGVADPWARRLLHLAVTMNSLPASYMKYYYYRDEMLSELRAKPTTRAQDIAAALPDYWAHYREQLGRPDPTLDPGRSRGGIFELEVAVDVMDAVFNDKNEVWPANVVNAGAISDFPDGRVVELSCLVNAQGVRPLGGYRVPPAVRALVSALGEYQQLAADAAWAGGRQQAVQALASNPLVPTLPLAETLYGELARAPPRPPAGAAVVVEVLPGSAALAVRAADLIAAEVRRKPDLSVLVATGNTPMRTYAELARRVKAGQLDCSRATAVQLDEYLGLDEGDPRSLYGWMERAFVRPLGMTKVVRLKEAQAFEARLNDLGGLDLAILGLGPNGHLGFNEPPSSPDSPTREVTLTPESLASNAGYWQGLSVPTRAITAGMNVILAAKRCLLLVEGAHKRDILARTLNGPATPELPASLLRGKGVTVLTDAAASSAAPA